MKTTTASPSSSFDLLNARVQRWIWRQGWEGLRDIQEEAIPAIVDNDDDVVIASATASGKTEAAVLPIGSALASEPSDGLGLVYVSPLKALINDQYPRLEGFFADLDLPVHPWHGDVSSSRKRRVREQPSGVLLITPESLEALFVRHGSKIPRMIRGLRYVVVDELHAFMGTERGRQLQTLLHRLELAARQRIRRIALSATIGDMALACEFLRPGAGAKVRRIVSTSSGRNVRLQVRGYRITPLGSGGQAGRRSDPGGRTTRDEGRGTGDAIEISEHLFETLRGGRHIAFVNSRANVELYSDLLRRRSENAGIPNEFHPHHGSLDKALREKAEDALKCETQPATIVATTTLELGVDFPLVETTAQIGPPPSVASMRQRLGRSGRRGEPSVARIYIQEPEITPRTPPEDQLRTNLVQAVAAVRLLIAGYSESPRVGALHLSTLIQQLLSLIAQHGGVRASQAWNALCRSGPFSAVERETFRGLLDDLQVSELIKKTHDDELVLDGPGERLVNHYDFYAAFTTPEEFRLVAGAKTLGTLPITSPVVPGTCRIFAGQRWRILSVDVRRRVIELVPSPGGSAPTFVGTGALVHDRVRDEMRQVYLSRGHLPYLDGTALCLLQEGREAFDRFGLAGKGVLESGKDSLLFPWVGDRALNTLLIQLRKEGFSATEAGVAIMVEEVAPDELKTRLTRLAGADPPDPRLLAAMVSNKRVEKHHRFLGQELLCADYASSQLDVPGSRIAVRRLLGGDRSET